MPPDKKVSLTFANLSQIEQKYKNTQQKHITEQTYIGKKQKKESH